MFANALTAIPLSSHNICILFSTASAIKRGEKVCGDTATTFSIGDGKHVVCILDGMGSGSDAAKDSADYTRLLKKLILHGLDKKEAVRFINEQLMGEKRERILGIDIISVDLSAGYMDTCKAGAAPTYLVRGGKVYEFGSASVPVGVLADADMEVNRCRICSGDTIVMVSDGFSEKGGEWMGRRLFDRISSGITSCLELSEALLSDACDEDLDAYDDLTVVTLKIV